MKYGYLPPDLQRAGQHMERVAFLRNLQKSLADQNYIRTHGGDSGLSEHGAVGLSEKVAMVASGIAKPKAKAAPIGMEHFFWVGSASRAEPKSCTWVVSFSAAWRFAWDASGAATWIQPGS